MSTGNQVVVTLTARDHISPEIAHIMRGFAGLRGGLSGFDNSVSSLGGAVAGVGTKILGWTGAILGAGTALVGLGKLTEGFKEALGSETSSLGAANGLAQAFGLSLAQATLENDKLNLSLSKSAMSLPGSAKDFKSLKDGISGAVSLGLSGDINKYKEMINPLVSKLAVISQGSVGGSINSGQTAVGVNKFLTEGSGMADTMQMDIFEKNPALKKAIKDAIGIAGYTDKTFAKATSETRLSILKAATDIAANPEYIAALRQTAGATLGELSDTFFDPDNGIFGWLRKVKLTGNKETSTLQSFQVFMASIQDMVAAFGKKGIGLDPMQAMSDMFRSFSQTIRNVTSIIDKGGDIWNDLTYAFGKKLTDGLNSLTGILTKIDWKELGYNFGSNIAKILLDPKLGDALVLSLNAALDGLAKGIGSAIASAGSLFVNQLGKETGIGGVIDGGRKADMEQRKLQDSNANPILKFFGVTPESPIGRIFSPQSLLPSQPLPAIQPQSFVPQGTQGSTTANNNTFNIQAAGLSPSEMIAAINAEYQRYKGGLMA